MTSNFSFSHSVFYLFEELSAVSNKIEIIVCSLFQFGRVLNLSFGKGSKRTQENRAITSLIDHLSRQAYTRSWTGLRYHSSLRKSKHISRSDKITRAFKGCAIKTIVLFLF